MALVALMSALAAATSFTVVLAPPHASADQIADLKAEAAAVSQKLVQDQLQVGADQQLYAVSTQKVATDARAITQIGQELSQAQAQINKETGQIRHQAIASYMDDGSELSGTGAVLFNGDQETAQVTSEYASVATGDIQTTVDQLENAERTLQAETATLQQQQALELSAQMKQASSLAEANSTAAQLESLQGTVTGQLAAAVAAQAAAQKAAAAAAVAAAQAAAARASGTRLTSVPASGLDPALNSFLQCVVQAESSGNYAAVSPNGLYMGAFQFSQSTWNVGARAAGLTNLVGVPPNQASKPEQDAVAVALYALDGHQPWLGDRC